MTATGAATTVAPASEKARSRLQLSAVGVGSAFILVGILGFIPGVTSNYHGTGGMGFSGLHSHAELLHVFRVSVFHNGVHLLLGGAGLVASFKPNWARVYLVVGGAAYLVLCVYGFVIDQGTNANFVPINAADNWLHLALGVGMIVLGALVGHERRRRR
jgi:Domain of unknown function (DUF4383)